MSVVRARMDGAVTAGAHLACAWLFEPAKRPNDRADYCLYSSFLPKCKRQIFVFTVDWIGARPLGEQW